MMNVFQRLQHWRWFGCLVLMLSTPVWALDPTCDTSWQKTNSQWTCTGNGKVTFTAQSNFQPSATLTISANNGFQIDRNIIGSNAARVNLVSDYGAITAVGPSQVVGNISASSAVITLNQTTVQGTLTTSGNIQLTGGSVSGLVTSSSNTINTNGTTLSAGARANSGITITGGVVNGPLTMLAQNIVRLTNVNMPSGQISGASSVYLVGSALGSSTQNVNVTSQSNDIYLQQGTVVYGTVSAAANFHGTVQVQDGSQVYGSCLPKSNPLDACNAQPPATVHHYELLFNGPGVTCEAETVTVRACQDASCNTLYTGSSSVTLSANNQASWSEASIALSQGSGVSALRKTTAGSSTLGISSATPAAASALVCRNAGQISACSLTFAETALKFYSNNGSSQIPSGVAGQAQQVQLRAIQTDPESGACAARVQGSRAVGLAFRCLNPSSCVADQRLTMAGQALAGSGATPQYQNVSLTFDANGRSSFPVSYSDVGQIALHARLVLAGQGVQPEITLTAPASAFIVRPYQLAVVAVSRQRDQFANPQTTAAGVGFAAAGEALQVRLEARNAALARTPNFGLEVQPQRLQLSFVSLEYPQGGTGSSAQLLQSGDFLPVAGVPGQVQHQQVSFLEAGTIRLRAQLKNGSYLAAGDAVDKPVSVPIGRFYPAEFRLSDVSVTPTCAAGNFSYFRQPGVGINFNLTAVNSQGNRLLNYHQGSYQGVATLALVAENVGASPLHALGGRWSGLPAGSWQQGQYQFVSTGLLTFNRQQATVAEAPLLSLQSGVRVVSELDQRDIADRDMNADHALDCQATASCNAIKLGPTQQFYDGRLKLHSAAGTAGQDLPLLLEAQYYTGTQYTTQVLDQCTTVNPAQLLTSGQPLLLVEGEMGVLQQGQNAPSSLRLKAPQQNGRWFLEYQVPDYLKYPWKSGPTTLQNPSAEAIFGQYRGNDKLIYQREQ